MNLELIENPQEGSRGYNFLVGFGIKPYPDSIYIIRPLKIKEVSERGYTVNHGISS